MVLLSYEDFSTRVALEEVRALLVHELHYLPAPAVYVFEDERGNEVEWTTDRDYWEMNKVTGCKRPSEFTLDATSPHETVGELERRKQLNLIKARIVVREERKDENGEP